MINGKRRRSPRQAELRERDRAIHDASLALSLLKNGGEDPTFALQGTFISKRSVETTELDPFSHPVIKDILTDSRNKMAQKKVEPGVSLITPVEVTRVARRSGRPSEELMDLATKAVEGFPDELKGRLGAVAIFGAKINERGPRFVGFTLGRHPGSLGERLSIERSALVSEIGATEFVRPDRTPHISLYKTNDQILATDIAKTLKGTRISGEAIVLGPVTTDPVHQNLGTNPDTIRS